MQQAKSLSPLSSLRAGIGLLASIFLFSALAVVSLYPSQAAAKANPRYASIVMDADTGVILHQRYADKKLHPASLTKVMTLTMLFDALERGTVKLNDRIYISKHAAGMVPSKLGLAAGSSIRVQDAIYALVTKSANDIAVAIAEHLGRTETNFAYLMTRRAHAMGMNNTTFKNASGLHDPRQVSTARDMAKMAQVVIRQYPEYYRYFSTQNFTYAGQTYRNHNRLLGKYPGMDGMKTGYVQASGFNLVASAVRDNRRLIGVVFGGRSGASRNAHMAELLDNGFGKAQEIRLASAKAPIPARKPGIIMALNQITESMPATGIAAGSAAEVRTAMLENSNFGEIIGEGDNDPDAAERIETGLMAIAAHRNKGAAYRAANTPRPILANYSASTPSSWAVQIGAFTSRAATDKALRDTLKKLPRRYADVSPIIAPLKTDDGWLFRGRLNGYSRADAFRACKYLNECMPVAPQNN